MNGRKIRATKKKTVSKSLRSRIELTNVYAEIDREVLRGGVEETDSFIADNAPTYQDFLDRPRFTVLSGCVTPFNQSIYRFYL